MSLSEKVHRAARSIPRGRVATYSDISRAIGRPRAKRLAPPEHLNNVSRAWRAVGNILHKNRDSGTPCHRVVRSDGEVGGFGYPGGTKEKIRRLKQEGVAVMRGIVSLPRFRISPPDKISR